MGNVCMLTVNLASVNACRLETKLLFQKRAENSEGEYGSRINVYDN